MNQVHLLNAIHPTMSNKKQLFLLHFAGGNSYSFQFMRQYLDDKFEFIPLELPGRGRRVLDELCSSREEAIMDYFHQIREKRRNCSYILYGHSMGASLSVEVARLLSQINDSPERVFVTGNAGPGVERKEKRYLLPNDVFIGKLKDLGGVPKGVFETQELMDYFLPIIRADFEIVEKSEPVGNFQKINIPIVAVMGENEDNVDKLENWKSVSSKDVRTQTLPGNHFFIHQCAEQLAQIISEDYD